MSFLLLTSIPLKEATYNHLSKAPVCEYASLTRGHAKRVNPITLNWKFSAEETIHTFYTDVLENKELHTFITEYAKLSFLLLMDSMILLSCKHESTLIKWTKL